METVRRVADFLLENKFTMGTAESCTGGNIAHLLTLVPGSSEYFQGAIVSYSNNVKHDVLEVSWDTLQAFGAVSREVVEEMLIGARKVLDCQCAVATSGVAGPTGGTPEKPVGTVWIGATIKGTFNIRCYHFGTDRERNIELASKAALELLLETGKSLNLPL